MYLRFDFQKICNTSIKSGISLMVCCLGIIPSDVKSQSTYFWVGGANGQMSVPKSWNTNMGGGGSQRTRPDVQDVLVINGQDISEDPGMQQGDVVLDLDNDESVRSLMLFNRQTLTIQASAPAVIKLAGGPEADFFIEQGSTLNITGSHPVEIHIPAGVNGEVWGNINISGGAHRIIVSDPAALIFKAGSVCKTDGGFTGHLFGSGGNDMAVVFENGSKYIAGAGSDPFGTGSKVQFAKTSHYVHKMNTAPSFEGRTYGHFEYSNGGTCDITSGKQHVTVTNLVVATGTLNIIGFNGEISIKGNLQCNGRLNYSPCATSGLAFDGKQTAVVSGSGSIVISDKVETRIEPWTRVLLSRDIRFGGDLIIEKGGSLDVSTKNFTVSIGGDLYVFGVIMERKGKFIFDGLHPQAIQGAIAFHHLDLNNQSGLSLIGDSNTRVGITGDMYLISGDIHTNEKLTLMASTISEYGQISGAGNGNVVGEIKVEKVLHNTQAGWRQISLPVDGTAETLHSDNLRMNFSGDAQHSVYFWDASPNTGVRAHGWRMADRNNKNGCYNVENDNADPLISISSRFSVTGAPNTGNFGPITLHYTQDPSPSGPNSQGWNMVPNPYPSNINPVALFHSPGFPSYKAVHIWDQISGQYVAITATGVIVHNGVKSRGLSPTNNNIPPFTPFWVKADASGNTITLTNTMRTTEIESQTFMKNGRDLVRLDVYGKDETWDQMVVYFENGATPEFDNTMDAYKLTSHLDDVPSLYTMSGNEALSVSALPIGEKEYHVPAVFVSKKHGEKFTLVMNTEEYHMNKEIWLEDHKTGELIDLTNDAYTFIHDRNFTGPRFTVHFGNNVTAIERPVSQGANADFYSYNQDGQLYVNYKGLAEKAEIEVIDMMGRSHYTGPLYNGDQVLPISSEVKGCLILKVTADNQTVSKKVVR